MGRHNEEFPNLAEQGLYAADIQGNGNCLFNALSDQLYGDQSHHAAIRARVIDYMRDNKSHFKQFLDVTTGVGQRRNPKRKVTGSYNSPSLTPSPSPDEIDAVFEGHLLRMAKGGTWGDHMEVSAFGEAYKVDVKIYLHTSNYVLQWGRGMREIGEGGPIVHIAYHIWQHYSSIRNTKGPHTGLPQVQPTVSAYDGPLARPQPKTPRIPDWMVDNVLKSLPYITDRSTAKRALEQQHGDIDAAVSVLMDAEERSSSCSTTGESSIERDADSDDEEPIGPKKKQNRRLSKASTALILADRAMAVPISRTGKAKIEGHKISPMQEKHIVDLTELPDEDAEWRPEPHVKGDDTDSSSSETSQNSFDRSTSSTSSTSEPAPVQPAKLKWRPKQSGPRRMTARDRKDAKKALQKAAAKERKQEKATGKTLTHNQPPTLKMGKANAPIVEKPFRTLYI